jgi:hypothetical protein
VGPRRRHQRGQAAEQFAALEDEEIAAVTEAPFHAIGELAIAYREPLLRERWASAVAAEVREALFRPSGRGWRMAPYMQAGAAQPLIDIKSSAAFAPPHLLRGGLRRCHWVNRAARSLD